eukprot:TRINITY_DN2071_c0_g2_i1.p1 TRINITY_DN2071_c0_g2~~TRINITY_DN2071_c0_g2_i1.p1  ORF type:complete len:122 (-),score=10.78 TRINITY_DN2071_c0_g2_i1:331-696(-)
MLSKSFRNASGSDPLSTAAFSSAIPAASAAIRYHAITVCGWILESSNFSASRNSSLASTHTEVVTSPTSSPRTLDMPMSTFGGSVMDPNALQNSGVVVGDLDIPAGGLEKFIHSFRSKPSF